MQTTRPTRFGAATRGTTPREWLADVVASRDIKQPELARATGLDQATISRALAANGSGPSDLTLLAVAKALRIAVPEEVLARAKPGRSRRGERQTEAGIRRADPITGAVAARPDEDVPIWATPFIGQGPLFHLNRAVSEFAPRPRGIGSARDVICIRMPDDSMVPWRMPNEFVYFDAARPLIPGGHALVLLRMSHGPEAGLICRLRARPEPGRPAQIELYGRPVPPEIERMEFTSGRAAVEWMDLLGR